jgi:hypothetical protein
VDLLDYGVVNKTPIFWFVDLKVHVVQQQPTFRFRFRIPFTGRELCLHCEPITTMYQVGGLGGTDCRLFEEKTTRKLQSLMLK